MNDLNLNSKTPTGDLHTAWTRHKDFLEKLRKDSEDKLIKTDITDRDRYILNHKIDTIKGINL